MAHLAVTDVEGGRFDAFQRYARGAAGLAGARVEPFRVWVADWQVASTATGDGDGDAAIFPLRLAAAEGDVALDLRLEAGGPPVLQGDGGLSRKGRGPDAGASYYYSMPRLDTRGTLRLGDESFTVEGASWLDREWSSAVLGAGKEGWDWFAVQLDDGRDLVFFRIRGGDGPADRLGYAALLSPAGAPADAEAAAGEPRQAEVLDVTGSSLRPVGHWRSRASGVRYPSGWRLLVPSAGLHLGLTPLLDDQELDLDFRYWEGAIRVEGTAGGEPVRGRGYAELTGYGEGRGLR
jgi:predicted secreted hydrolase